MSYIKTILILGLITFNFSFSFAQTNQTNEEILLKRIHESKLIQPSVNSKLAPSNTYICYNTESVEITEEELRIIEANRDSYFTIRTFLNGKGIDILPGTNSIEENE